MQAKFKFIVDFKKIKENQMVNHTATSLNVNILNFKEFNEKNERTVQGLFAYIDCKQVRFDISGFNVFILYLIYCNGISDQHGYVPFVVGIHVFMHTRILLSSIGKTNEFDMWRGRI